MGRKLSSNPPFLLFQPPIISFKDSILGIEFLYRSIQPDQYYLLLSAFSVFLVYGRKCESSFSNPPPPFFQPLIITFQEIFRPLLFPSSNYPPSVIVQLWTNYSTIIQKNLQLHMVEILNTENRLNPPFRIFDEKAVPCQLRSTSIYIHQK